MSQEIKKFLDAEAKAVLNIPTSNNYDKAIEIIHKAVHRLNGKVVTSGVGKAGQIALNIATTFSSTGTPAIFLHSGDAQHGDLGVIQKNDVFLLISNSGKTREVLEQVYLSQNLYKELPIIVITGDKKSPLAELADVVLHTGGPKEICPLGLTPTTSMTTMNVIGDILIVLMMHRISFTREEYAKRHHGGYIGQELKKPIKEKK